MTSTAHRPLARRSRRALPRGGERGFSLIVALMMLIVIIILGISASQMAINEERGARNDRDRQLAFQAAEAALRDAQFEIYGSTSAATRCDLPGQVGRGRKRAGTYTCFNESNYFGYALGCSAPPNAGLCINNPAMPAYLDGTNVDFYKDASGGSGANYHTVAYGTYSGRVFGAQDTLGAGVPVSKYPPRYIIEAVPKNTSFDSQTTDGSGAGQAGTIMFRVTAMGFGANPASQVVLQAVVATQD